MRLSELLEDIDRRAAGQSSPKPLPEALCTTLREVADRYARQNPFKPGDLITPCVAGDMKGAGEPHVVLEVRGRPEPDFANAKSVADTTSNAFGRRSDIRVASRCGDDIAPFWVESWQFELYRGPGSEAAAA